MVKHNVVNDTTDVEAQKEAARQQIAALLDQFGSSIVPVTVAAERVESAKTEHAAEVAALNQENTDLRAQIDPLNAKIKENVIKILALTGRKSLSAATGTRAPRTESKCPECGQGRHSYWKNKAKGERNMVTENCKTFAAKEAARLAAKPAGPVQELLPQ